MINLLLADDHALVREGLKQLIEKNADLHIAGEAANGDEVLRLVRQKALDKLPLDMLLLDMSMPGKSGIELIKQIKREMPGLPILVISMHDEGQYAVRALKSGASGYMHKDSAPELLVQAIRKIAGGGVFVSAALAESMALQLMHGAGAAPHTLLSDREFQVFRMIALGKTITEIAAQLSLSVKTISTHKTRILEKMNLRNQTELIRYALQHQLIDDAINDNK